MHKLMLMLSAVSCIVSAPAPDPWLLQYGFIFSPAAPLFLQTQKNKNEVDMCIQVRNVRS